MAKDKTKVWHTDETLTKDNNDSNYKVKKYMEIKKYCNLKDNKDVQLFYIHDIDNYNSLIDKLYKLNEQELELLQEKEKFTNVDLFTNSNSTNNHTIKKYSYVIFFNTSIFIIIILLLFIVKNCNE